MSSNAKPFPGQHAGEDVELVFRRHISVIRKQLIVTLMVILVTSIPALLWPLQSWTLWFWFAGIVVALLYFFYYWVGWYYSLYVVTNERIIEIRQKGLFNRRVSEFGLDKVQNINYHIQGLEAVVLRFGDITVQTYVGDLVMTSIHHPVKIHEQLVDVVRKFNAEVQRHGDGRKPGQKDAEMVQ